MHTEHLNNVGIGPVLMGWFIAVAIASLLLLTLLGFGSGDSLDWGPALAVVAGFLAGGFACGFRALRAPVLHGIAIGLVSVLAATALALVGDLIGPARWSDLGANAVIILVMAQFAAAVIGSLLGYNVAVRGKPGLGEPDLPV